MWILLLVAVQGAAVYEQNTKSSSGVKFSLFVGFAVACTAAAVYLGRKIKKTITDGGVDVEHQPAFHDEIKQNERDNGEKLETSAPRPTGKVGSIVENLEKDIQNTPSIPMIKRQESFDPRRAASPKRF